MVHQTTSCGQEMSIVKNHWSNSWFTKLRLVGRKCPSFSIHQLLMVLEFDKAYGAHCSTLIFIYVLILHLHTWGGIPATICCNYYIFILKLLYLCLVVNLMAIMQKKLTVDSLLSVTEVRLLLYVQSRRCTVTQCACSCIC